MASKLTHEVPDATQEVPQATERQRSVLFPRRRTTPRIARNFVVTTLTEWGETSRLDDVRLCASELVTNAVLHGTPAGRLVLVRVGSLADHVLLEVHDAGDDAPAQRAPEETDVGGRGLLIVSSTADRWGVRERTGPGKCVWAAFERTREGDTT